MCRSTRPTAGWTGGQGNPNQPDIHVAGSVIDVAALATEEGSETGSTTGGGTAAVDSELAGIVTGREDSGETGREALARPGRGRAALGTGRGRSGRREEQGDCVVCWEVSQVFLCRDHNGDKLHYNEH